VMEQSDPDKIEELIAGFIPSGAAR
jgi:hypothetical protein